MSYPSVMVRADKAANAIFRHPWIFSGAIARMENGIQHGSLVSVKDPNGRLLGVGTYSSSSSIAVRLLDFQERVIDRAWFARRFQEADARRHLLGYGLDTETDGYRLLFGESDGIPGLIVDRYRDVFVIQIATAGLDHLREEIVAALVKTFKPKAVIERSDMPVRKEEGLEEKTDVLYGDDP